MGGGRPGGAGAAIPGQVCWGNLVGITAALAGDAPGYPGPVCLVWLVWLVWLVHGRSEQGSVGRKWALRARNCWKNKHRQVKEGLEEKKKDGVTRQPRDAKPKDGRVRGFATTANYFTYTTEFIQQSLPDAATEFIEQSLSECRRVHRAEFVGMPPVTVENVAPPGYLMPEALGAGGAWQAWRVLRMSCVRVIRPRLYQEYQLRQTGVFDLTPALMTEHVSRACDMLRSDSFSAWEAK
ncbi:hypothetical protein EGW08_001716 [Elysia chlorotica]|uniref:Uncharacterized protein n=1 Tax=Elysia chlorotica TaxID=188477 RepID=A0A433U9R5_ELYCH|nr:hypothetical protein EGW08_001716 [Elysia chlorotica]